MLIKNFISLCVACSCFFASPSVTANPHLINFTGILSGQDTKIVPVTISAHSSVRLIIYPDLSTSTLTCKFSDTKSNMITFAQSHKSVCVVNIKSFETLNLLAAITNDQNITVNYHITVTNK